MSIYILTEEKRGIVDKKMVRELTQNDGDVWRFE